MQAQVTNIQILLAGGNTFSIPIYQRRYAWSTESALDLLTSIKNTNRDNPIIIGAITCVTHGFGRNIVDGQQRLTTISLIIAAIKDYFSNKTNYQEIINNCNACLFMPFNPAGNKINLKTEDNYIHSIIIRGGEIPQNTPEDNRIKNNYTAIKETINILNEEEVISIFQKTMSTQIVEILVNNTENPQKIFEALNSKGQDLTKIDLITNLIFMEMPIALQENAYNLTWSAIENRLNSEEMATDFLRSFLSINLERTENLAAKNLYNAFKNDYLSNRTNQQQDPHLIAISELNKFFQAYEIVTGHAEDPEISSHLLSIRKLNIAQANTLLTFLQIKRATQEISTETFLAILKIIEAYIARRALIQLTSAGLFRILTRLAIKLKNENPQDYLETTKQYFAKLDAAARFPRDGEIIEELKIANFYAYNPASKMLFFEKIIKQEYDNQYNIEIGNKTLEHIMPQTLNNEWNDFLGEGAQELHSRHLHTIGNLTIVPQNINTLLGQASLENKIRILQEGSENYPPPPYQRIFQIIYQTDGQIWNSEVIESNSQYYSNLLLQAYPEPEDFHPHPEEEIIEIYPIEEVQINDILGNTDRVRTYREIETLLTKNNLRPIPGGRAIHFMCIRETATPVSIHPTYGARNIRLMLDIEEASATPGTQIGEIVSNLQAIFGQNAYWINHPENNAAGAFKVIINQDNINNLIPLLNNFIASYQSN